MFLREVKMSHAGVPSPAFEQRLLEAVGHAVIATDADGTVLYWNAAAEQLYGWSASEAVGRPILELTPSGASREQAEEIMTALRGGLCWTGEFSVQRKDGSAFVALVTNRPLRDHTGEICGVIGVSADITERVLAERAARGMEAVVASMGEAVVTTSPEGEILTWNAAATELYGWAPEEAVGQHISLVVPPDSAEAAAAVVERLRAGAVVRAEVQRRRRDGSTVAVTLTASPVLDLEGRYVGASSVTRVATPRACVDAPPALAVEQATSTSSSLSAPASARAPRRRPEVATEHGLARLWELYGEGASLATIAAALNRDGYRSPSGHRWHGNAVARVLDEPSASHDEE